MIELYLLDDGKAAGPYPEEQILEMLAGGDITPEQKVAEHRDGPWLALREVVEILPDNAAAADGERDAAGEARRAAAGADGDDAAEGALVRWVDTVARRRFARFADGDGWRRYLAAVALWGARGLLACGAICFLFSIAEALQLEQLFPLCAGAVILALTVAGHYFATKFNAANLSLLDAEPVALGSTAVPGSLAVIGLAGVIVSVFAALGGCWFFARDGAWDQAAGALIASGMAAVAFFHLAGLCAHCGPTLRMDAARRRLSGGEACVGAVRFGARLWLALGVVAFGYGTAAVAARLAVSGAADLVAGRKPLPGGWLALMDSGLWSSLKAAAQHAWELLALIAAPLTLYFGYVLALLLADVLAAIFRTARNTARTGSGAAAAGDAAADDDQAAIGSPSAPAHDTAFPWREFSASLAALTVGAALVAGAALWQKKLAVPPDETVRNFVATDQPAGAPWSLGTLALKKIPEGGGSRVATVSVAAQLALRENLYEDADVEKSFAAAGLSLPDIGRLAARAQKLIEPERGKLLRSLREKNLLRDDAGQGGLSVIDRRVVKQTAAAGQDVTVSGELIAEKKGGAWQLQKIAVDWAPLALGERLEKFGATAVAADSDEFKTWAAQAAANAREFEKMLADSEAAARAHVAELKKKAADGDAAAMLALARLYESGESYDAFALSLPQRQKAGAPAAAAGTAAPAVALSMPREEELPGQNLLEAAKWHLRAAELGSAEAQHKIGFLLLANKVPENFSSVKFWTWLEKSAKQNYAPAQNDWGWVLSQQKNDAQRAEAAEWFRKAADSGSADAQYNLAALSCQGGGAARDFGEAVKWLEKAAAQGHAQGRNALGVLLWRGDGAAKNTARAAELFAQSARQGNAAAMGNRAYALQQGAVAAADDDTAAQWFHRAAAAGNEAAKTPGEYELQW